MAIVALAVALVAGAIGAWWFFNGSDGDAVRLSLALPRKGAVVFRVHNSTGVDADYIGAFEFQSEFDGILTLRTGSVEDDYTRVRGLLDVSSLVWNGRPETGRPTLRARFRLRSDGNVVGGNWFDPGVLAGTYDPVTAGLSPDLPPYPVRPGDAWRDKYRLRQKKDRVSVTTSSKFLRYDELKGVRVAVVQGTRTLELSSIPGRKNALKGTVSVDQTAWIDPALGTVLRMTATITGDVTARGSGGRARLYGTERLELTAL